MTGCLSQENRLASGSSSTGNSRCRQWRPVWLWVLNPEGSTGKYQTQHWQESLSLNIFNANVRTRPCIVLSNNDGCVVARSNDIKKLVKMGQPVFEIADLIRGHNIAVFSSNYSLYADMSSRVLRVLSEFSKHLESYSIDEAFLTLTHLSIPDLLLWGKEIKEKVFKFTGIPVSVGIATSKTLSKIACEIVKKNPEQGGVLDLSCLSDELLDEYLSNVEIGDVWGIGHQYTKFLKSRGIDTAKDLKYSDPKIIRKHLTVVGERTVLELRGIACNPLEEEVKSKKASCALECFPKT
jgi:DNA polymerase V